MAGAILALRAEGLLAIVCPVLDDGELRGIGLFNTTAEQAARIMDRDAGVMAGIFTYEVHPVRSLPGDCLPSDVVVTGLTLGLHKGAVSRRR